MSRHLGDLVTAYVDRRLDPVTLRDLDRHLVSCEMCRCQAEAERRLLWSLRSTAGPDVPGGLQSMLLRLGSDLVPAAAPTAPATQSPGRVPTIAPAAPAQHRSAARAALLAGLTASFSAAAAWAVAVSGVPTQPTGRAVSGPAGASPAPAVFAVPAVQRGPSAATVVDAGLLGGARTSPATRR